MTSSGVTLAGAAVMIAGATGGIGSAVAGELHRRGARLALVGRDEHRLHQLQAPGQRLALDLRSPEACRKAISEAKNRHGRLDAVVNAVGVVAFGSTSELSVDAMEELFLTNTFLPIMLAKAALPELEHGGAIVNLSGVIAEQNLPGMAAYGASKAALTSFDQAFSREARRAGVTVIDARPPHTETGLAQRPIEGTAPSMRPGLDPNRVATVICDAIAEGATDLPSSAF
ncbi:MAG: SDR family oxidoreductase [Acidimicrobiia bacterium]|nr:SDR family oxidoreductase [Acidimicrobiia bacterium]